MSKQVARRNKAAAILMHASTSIWAALALALWLHHKEELGPRERLETVQVEGLRLQQLRAVAIPGVVSWGSCRRMQKIVHAPRCPCTPLRARSAWICCEPSTMYSLT